jgi:hypothetical protein
MRFITFSRNVLFMVIIYKHLNKNISVWCISPLLSFSLCVKKRTLHHKGLYVWNNFRISKKLFYSYWCVWYGNSSCLMYIFLTAKEIRAIRLTKTCNASKCLCSYKYTCIIRLNFSNQITQPSPRQWSMEMYSSFVARCPDPLK